MRPMHRNGIQFWMQDVLGKFPDAVGQGSSQGASIASKDQARTPSLATSHQKICQLVQSLLLGYSTRGDVARAT